MRLCVAGAGSFVNSLPAWLLAVFNTGGPQSRTRAEPINASLLGNDRMSIQWPRCLQVGIAFPPDCEARTYMEEFLARQGWTMSEACKDLVTLPPGPYFCSDVPPEQAERLNPETAAPLAVLRAALILTLCNSHSYDQGRPVIWTNSRLTRTVALYQPGNFYADN